MNPPPKIWHRPKIVGIVNITTDSFSDGGLFLETDDAIAHARNLASGGADVVELGAASSHPDSGEVTSSQEIARLEPVLDILLSEGHIVGVDTTQPAVQRFCMERGAQYLNDIRGFPEPELYRELGASGSRLVVMHSVDQATHARRRPTDPATVYHSMLAFFDDRLRQLAAAGVDRERIIIDPGMGYFLGGNPETSLAILARVAELNEKFECPLFLCVSRKSFLRNLPASGECDVQARTLAAELYAAIAGVEYIRTHDAAALHQALMVLEAIGGARSFIPD